MNSLSERLERIEVEEPVHIPNLDGTAIAETVTVKVTALRDPKDGEIYLDTEATALLDKVKARHMGLLLPEQIRALRAKLGLTQQQISELLQIGEKTWTRWETGRERPSRVINVLLCALNDGKLDTAYLQSVARRRNDWTAQLTEECCAPSNPWLPTAVEKWQGWRPQAGIELGKAIHDAVAGLLGCRSLQVDFEFSVKDEVDLLPSFSGTTIALEPFEQVVLPGRSIRPARPDQGHSPRFEIPDTLVA